MASTFLYIAIFAIFSAIVNGIGILAISKKTQWVDKVKNLAICFAAGMLIAVPLLHALPHAVTEVSVPLFAGLMALGGFLFMLLSNSYIQKRTQKRSLAFGITAAEGIALHSLIDGLIYTVTFTESIFAGILAATGLVIHEFAEGVITYIVLRESDIEDKKAKLYAFLIAGLTTPIGAFVAYPLINQVQEHTLGLLMGFVGGVLIYISAAHLLPEARRGGHNHGSSDQLDPEEELDAHSIYAHLVGVGLAVLMVLVEFFAHN